MPQDKLYEDGMKVRRHILGNAHVDKASALTTDVNREFQELIIRYGCDSSRCINTYRWYGSG